MNWIALVGIITFAMQRGQIVYAVFNAVGHWLPVTSIQLCRNSKRAAVCETSEHTQACRSKACLLSKPHALFLNQI